MSKRELKKFLSNSNFQELQEQLLMLYAKFPVVKEYYDFVFFPNEEQRLGEAQQKIKQEYFPMRGKRPKQRRSVANKFIKHFKTLGMDPVLVLELVLYNLDLMVRFASKKPVAEISFSRSVLNSYKQAVDGVIQENLLHTHREKLSNQLEGIRKLGWANQWEFDREWERLEN